MKVAVCFSGMPRFVQQTFAYWQRCLIKPYNPDVFVHLWRTNTSQDQDIKNFILSTYNPLILSQEQVETFDVGLYKDRIWPHRTTPQTQLSQYYGIYRSQQLRWQYEANHNFKYDVVIRARFDWFLESVNLEINDCVNVAYTPTLCNHRFLWKGNEQIGISDQFAYGSSQHMSTYAQLVFNVPRLYSELGIDFAGELLLKSHLLDHNLEVKEHQWHNGIVRQTHIMP